MAQGIERTAECLGTYRMSLFNLAKKDGCESFKGNFIICLVNCFVSRPKNCYYSKSILKYVKDVNQIASLE